MGWLVQCPYYNDPIVVPVLAVRALATLYMLTKTVQNGGPLAISEILHIEYWIVCCIETYLTHIYHISKCSKCAIETGILKDFVCETCIFTSMGSSQLSPMLS